MVLFVLFAYATVTGLGDNVSSIGRSSVPFLVVADRDLGGVAILAWIAGIASVLTALVAGAGSQAHMLYDAGRSRLLPARLGQLAVRAGSAFALQRLPLPRPRPGRGGRGDRLAHGASPSG